MNDGNTSPHYFETLRKHFADSIPHGRDIGLRITALSEKGAWAELHYRPDWLGDTQRGLIHTGVITTVVDSVCGLAVLVALAKPQTIATLDLRMDYLRATLPDKTLFCHAVCYRLTRSIAFVRASAWQDDEAQPVAVSQSTFMFGSNKSRRKSA